MLEIKPAAWHISYKSYVILLKYYITINREKYFSELLRFCYKRLEKNLKYCIIWVEFILSQM